MKQPNFEQYKKDQEGIEKIPTTKPETHFVINDIAGKVLGDQPLSDKEMGDLEIIYNLTQDLEKELITFLDEKRARDIITKIEFLIVSDYFLVANQNGPDSNNLKNTIIESVIGGEEFDNYISNIEVPKNTKTVISNTYKKLNNSKTT